MNWVLDREKANEERKIKGEENKQRKIESGEKEEEKVLVTLFSLYRP